MNTALRTAEGLQEPLQEPLEEARRRLRGIYPSRLRRVILYGSQARGEAREKGHPSGESDVDVLVVLEGPVAPYTEIKRMSEMKMDLFERYRLYFSLLPYAEEAYQDMRRPFMQNVHAEGIELESHELQAP